MAFYGTNKMLQSRMYLIFGFLVLGLCRFKSSCYEEVGALVDAAAATESGSKFNIKIVEGLPKKKNTYTHSSTPVEPTPSRTPHSIPALTPLEYLPLDGKCFTENIGRYEYKICPFRNVTQLDKQTTWNPFYGLLGIWNKWKADDSADRQFQTQEYTDGTSCGNNIKRKVQVNFECNERYGISKVEEPRTCDYTMTFALPEACNITLPDLISHNSSITNGSEVEASVNVNNNQEVMGNLSDMIETEISTTSQECNEHEGSLVFESTPQCGNAVIDTSDDVMENTVIDIAKTYELIPQFNADGNPGHVVQTRWSSFSQAQLIKVKRDGDCGYSSVSFALKDLYTEEIPSGPELRKLVSLNPLKPPNLSQSNFENARKRSRSNKWIENEELSILSYLYGTCIVVYQPEASHAFDRWSMIMPGVSECPKTKTIYLRLKNTHFDALINLVEAVNNKM